MNTPFLFRSILSHDNGLQGESYFGLSGVVMDSYKDLRMSLGRQDKAKYSPWCVEDTLVPKTVDFASQFAHFCQLHGNNCSNTHLRLPFRKLWHYMCWCYYWSKYMVNSRIIWSFVDGLWIGWRRSTQQEKFNGGNCLYCIWKTIIRLGRTMRKLQLPLRGSQGLGGPIWIYRSA